MFIGTPLLATSTGNTYYTPWLARGGDSLTAACEIMQSSGISSMKISVATKNSEQTDSAAVSSAEHTMTSTSPGTLDSWEPTGGTWTGALELVRFKVVVQSSSGLGFVAARMLSPSWVTN
jgi:hypothetical protein